MLLKKLMAAVRSPSRAHAPPGAELPLEIEAKIARLHARADIRRHLDILYGDVSVGSQRFTDLYFRCLQETGTAITGFAVLPRFQTRYELLRYFLATLDVPGARAECGAYRGATALLLCHAWRSRSAAFNGEGFYLIDSYSGTPESSEQDFIPVRDESGSTRMESFFPPHKSDVTAEMVRNHLRDFPLARIEQGWIPHVLDALAESAWAFVHVDVTLYKPTLAALEYFYPRLSPGGVLLCEDSVFCPGVQKAIDAYSSAHDVPYVTLASRATVFTKP
jgi:hypothetical protein